MGKTIRYGTLTLLTMLTFVAVSPRLSAQLPPAIQADRLLVKAERQIRDKNFVAAVATLDRLSALSKQNGIEIPVVFWFKHASAAQGAGLYDRAIESATRYLQAAGQKGEHYLPALELLDGAESAKQREEQREKERKQREEQREKERKQREEQREKDFLQITRSFQKFEQAGKLHARENDYQDTYYFWSSLKMTFYDDCQFQIAVDITRLEEYHMDRDYKYRQLATVDATLDNPNIKVVWKNSYNHSPAWGGVLVEFNEDIVEEKSWDSGSFQGSSTSRRITLPLWTKAPNGILVKEVEETFDRIEALCRGN